MFINLLVCVKLWFRQIEKKIIRKKNAEKVNRKKKYQSAPLKNRAQVKEDDDCEEVPNTKQKKIKKMKKKKKIKILKKIIVDWVFICVYAVQSGHRRVLRAAAMCAGKRCARNIFSKRPSRNTEKKKQKLYKLTIFRDIIFVVVCVCVCLNWHYWNNRLPIYTQKLFRY